MRIISAIAMTIFAAFPGQGLAQPAPNITAAEWSAYVEHFVSPEGRVIDTGNGNISHSEGQGYGLLLAVLADDRPGFERIWSFTQTELMVRPDGLAAWRWEPDKTPHVSDANNATDGDMLIAYALARAGAAWSDPARTEAATTMVETIGTTMLTKAAGLTLILPGEHGFTAGEREDGPVVSPSYWVFEALSAFAELTPKIAWMSVRENGLKLLDQSRFGPRALPSDWISLARDEPQPAAGFPPEFAYNNIRIPLYLMRAGAERNALEPFAGMGNASGIERVDVTSGAVMETLTEPGYRLIAAALACTLDSTEVPADLQAFAPTSYYAATLQLLLLDHLRRQQPACLDAGATP